MLRRFYRSVLLPMLAAPAIPYGGQAAMEGVMMKGTKHAALAVRRRTGEVEVLDREVKSMFPGITKLPLVRGFFILWDMFGLGMWALKESSKRYEADMLAEEAEKKGKTEVPKAEDKPNWVQNVIMFISLAIALVIFKIVPAAAVTWIFHVIGWGPMRDIADPTLYQQFIANLIEGLIKLGIFVGYIWSIGRVREIARVFEYHGAEHIVINAYEDDSENQEIEFIQSHGVAHPRCGTSFIAILIVASIVLFTFLDWAIVAWFPNMVVDNIPVWYIRWPLRIVGLIPLAGISYEIIKAAFKFYANPLIRPLLKFGMIFQALTTRRPSDDQVRVSLASFNRARYLTEGIPEPIVHSMPEPVLAE